MITTAHELKLDAHHMEILTTHILSRPWFNRVWVFQELVLSRIPIVQIGRKRVGWDTLYTAFEQSSLDNSAKSKQSLTEQGGGDDSSGNLKRKAI